VGSVGGLAIEVNDAAMLGDLVMRMMWRESVGRLVTGSLKQ
jgi:hypothetical protein